MASPANCKAIAWLNLDALLLRFELKALNLTQEYILKANVSNPSRKINPVNMSWFIIVL